MNTTSTQKGHKKTDRSNASDAVRILSPRQELAILRGHVYEFDSKYRSRDKTPEKDVWRPYRFAVRDVVIGIVVIRHNVKDNTLEVDFCLTEDPPFFEEYTGTKMVTLFLLSEAFMCGSSMGIQFSKNVKGKQVPPLIYDLAYLSGVQLKFSEKGQITPSEARQLYLNLTGFSDEVQDVIKLLAVEGKVRPERICYMVNNGIWNREEIEILLMGSTFPENALLGKIRWETLLLLENSLLQARTACLGGALLRKLAHREVIQAGKVVDLEANERVVETSFNYRYQALEITCTEVLEIPWLENGTQKIKPGDLVIARLVARERSSIKHFRKVDTASLKALVDSHDTKRKRPKKHYFVLLPLDASELDTSTLKKYRKDVKELGARLMIAPDPVSEYDKDAIARLEKSEVTRQ